MRVSSHIEAATLDEALKSSERCLESHICYEFCIEIVLRESDVMRDCFERAMFRETVL